MESFKKINDCWFNFSFVVDYFVSKNGIVKNKDNHIMRQSLDKDGYLRVQLTVIENGKKKRKLLSVARLVLITFSPNKRYRDLTVHHINHIKTDNCIENLAWETREKNSKLNKIDKTHAYGSRNYGAKLSEQDVINIYDSILNGEDHTIVFKRYSHLITRDHFRKIITGKSWKILYKDYLNNKKVQRLVNP